MVDRMVLASQRRMAGAEIYGGATAPSAPVTNAIGREPSVPVIFTDLGDTWLEFSLADEILAEMAEEEVGINLLGILHANCSRTATRRWRGAETRVGLTDGSAVYDSTPQIGWFGDRGLKSRKYRKHDVLWLGGTPQTCKWWRLDISDPGNVDPSGLIVGKVVIDAAWQPEINMTYGGGGGLIDPSRKPRTEQGQVQPLSRTPHRLHRFRLAFQSEVQLYGYADDLDEAVGTTDPVLFMRESMPTANPLFPSLRQKKVIYGLQNQVGQINDTTFAIHEKNYELEELAA